MWIYLVWLGVAALPAIYNDIGATLILRRYDKLVNEEAKSAAKQERRP